MATAFSIWQHVWFSSDTHRCCTAEHVWFSSDTQHCCIAARKKRNASFNGEGTTPKAEAGFWLVTNCVQSVQCCISVCEFFTLPNFQFSTCICTILANKLLLELLFFRPCDYSPCQSTAHWLVTMERDMAERLHVLASLQQHADHISKMQML